MTEQTQVLTDEERNDLVEDNIRLVHFIIHKYFPNTKFEHEDLASIGCLGLIKASHSYNSDKSKFSTYASRCIRNEIAMLFRKKEIETIPIGVGDDDEGYLISPERIASKDNIEAKLVKKCELDMLSKVKCLTKLERQVLNLMYVYDMNQQDIALHFNLTQPYISRVHKKAIDKLRRVLNEGI